jgi:hypothetical protein
MEEEQRLSQEAATRKSWKAVDFVDVLPAEVSLHILSFVPIADLGATLPLVSKHTALPLIGRTLFLLPLILHELVAKSEEDEEDKRKGKGKGPPKVSLP